MVEPPSPVTLPPNVAVVLATLAEVGAVTTGTPTNSSTHEALGIPLANAVATAKPENEETGVEVKVVDDTLAVESYDRKTLCSLPS